MYYDNKRSFYIKQYGPAVLVLILSIVLIGSGVFIYLSNTKPADDNKVVATDHLENENNQPQDNNENVEQDNKVIPTSLENLQEMEKSNSMKVDSIVSGKVNVTVDNKKLTLTLIGIDLNNAKADINDILTKELVGKDVTIAFDKVKYENNNIYVYLYLDSILYNATLLENGIAKYLDEKTNISLKTELIQSQTYAKQNVLGVWEN